ncbi:MAG: hypothetical protein QOE56_502 [Solirubrobacterales bacterium]|jgi:hypothetical protein|nr:hypothetical protein [Solirubrobacterales bacterium]
MSDLPAGIDLGRHRDFEGRELGQWLRRGFLLLLIAFVIAALLNVFGQAPTTTTAEAGAATLTMTAPSRVRGGLLYQAKFQIDAHQAIGAPVLVLDRGWYDETTVNTVEPEPAGTTSDPGHIKLRYPPLKPGRTLVIYIDFQVNPTNVGSHDAGVALEDGSTPIASIDRSQIDFP